MAIEKISRFITTLSIAISLESVCHLAFGGFLSGFFRPILAICATFVKQKCEGTMANKPKDVGT